MRVMVQVLSPGVEHHQHTDGCTQPLGIGRHLAQRRGRPLHRQQVLRLLIEPVGAGQRLALGAVAVPARVVGDALLAAIEAVLDMAAQHGRAEGGQVTQRLALGV
jgi:hypothetical protein